MNGNNVSSKEKFEHLIGDFSRLCRMTDLEKLELMQSAKIEVDGVAMSLIHGDGALQGLLMVYCNFGEPPRGQEAVAYRALLAKNLLSYSVDGPIFSTAPDSAHVICATRYLLDGLKAEHLRAILAYLAALAKDWQHESRGSVLPSSATRIKRMPPSSRLLAEC